MKEHVVRMWKHIIKQGHHSPQNCQQKKVWAHLSILCKLLVAGNMNFAR